MKSTNRFDFAGNIKKKLKFSVKKTSASFPKDADVARDLQFVVKGSYFGRPSSGFFKPLIGLHGIRLKLLFHDFVD